MALRTFSTIGFGVRPCLMRPESRGEVRLRSADPRAPVWICQNFFAVRNDLEALREGAKRGREVIYQKALDGYRGDELSPGPHVKTDQEIEAWIRKTVNTSSHPSCTCPMGLDDQAGARSRDEGAGGDALRVVDDSAMPNVISGNLNAAVLMMAEKASDMIRGKPPLPAADN